MVSHKTSLLQEDIIAFCVQMTRFYVHGGLSPEETVLPLLVFKSGKAEIKETNPSSRKNEFRYLTKAISEIEIVNENSTPIEDIQLSIYSQG